ncbi:kynurenine formamidase [Flavobacteriaceae bacterium MAR_2010_105]|nr:kynurenine formamidase [Flavobacteriaceae bacterium MAR_2010_105]
MIATIQHKSSLFTVDLYKPLDISIPLKASKTNVNAWYLGSPNMEPVKNEDWIGSVKQGASVNFNNIQFNPHAHGTHTECLGHITEEFHSINKSLKQFFFKAEVISVAPEKYLKDTIISKEQIEFALNTKQCEALVIRTLPNTKEKKSRQYSNTNWTYLMEDAVAYLVERGVKHLLIDLPSVDREKDGGQLKSHKAFWNFNGKIRKDCTITELVYVPNKVKDGAYLLNLQIAPFENDATPSKPVLYQLIES